MRIILIDALNSPEGPRDIMITNMRKMGLDPSRNRYLIVTHGHGDHYGGAKFFQDRYGATMLASAPD